MLKILKVDHKKLKRIIEILGRVFLWFLPIILVHIYLYHLSSGKVPWYAYLAFLFIYMSITGEFNIFGFKKKRISLKKIEKKLNDEIQTGINLFTIILLVNILSLFEIRWYITTLGSLLILFALYMLEDYFSFYPFSHYDLKRKTEISVYISYDEYLLIYGFIFSLDLVKVLYEDWMLNTTQSFDLSLVYNVLLCTLIFSMAVVNILINSWRINRRFKSIINLKTKNLQQEKSHIIRVMKDISKLTLKKEDNEEHWRRNEILKTRLNQIEKEINEISGEYLLKPLNYLSKIPILIAVIYGLFEIFMRILELLNLS